MLSKTVFFWYNGLNILQKHNFMFSLGAFRRKKAPSKKEIQEWLFNDLMGQIEPELTAGNRGSTAIMLHTLSDKDLKQKLEDYQEAFQEFIRRWPQYIEEQAQKMQGIEQQIQEASKKFTTEKIEEIEDAISSID